MIPPRSSLSRPFFRSVLDPHQIALITPTHHRANPALQVLAKIRSPFCVNLHYSYQDDTCIYLTLTLVQMKDAHPGACLPLLRRSRACMHGWSAVGVGVDCRARTHSADDCFAHVFRLPMPMIPRRSTFAWL